MCRIAAYVGPPATLASLLYEPPHSLEHQAYAPRQMLKGHVNVDGTGVAWWPEAETEPLRYVSERPPWSDPNLPALAGRLSGRMLLAAVRSATPGVAFGTGAVAPFVRGDLAGAHNGWLGEFRAGTGRELSSRLPDGLHGLLDAGSDSLLLFLTVVKHLEAGVPGGLAGAMRAAATEAVEVCRDAGVEATLNLVTGDGTRLVALRSSWGTEGNNPLHVLQGGVRWPAGTVVASEPLDDDPAWERIADDHVVEVTPEGFTTAPFSPGDGGA